VPYRLVFLLGCLLGCGNSVPAAPPEGALPLRPAGSPDVVIFSVSGHAGAISAVLCTSGNNRPYLGDPGDAVDALRDAFDTLGLSVQAAHFSDRFEAGVPDPERWGFLELLASMEQVFDLWIDGFSNPTRIVLICHSHGTAWAHTATHVLDHVPVAALVTLDAICAFWECEHDQAIQQGGRVFPWDIARACAVWPVPGRPQPLDVLDVVFDNVALNLEVQSADTFVFDADDNYRLDGSRDGIHTLAAAEDHNGVRDAQSGAMTWVRDMVLALWD